MKTLEGIVAGLLADKKNEAQRPCEKNGYRPRNLEEEAHW